SLSMSSGDFDADGKTDLLFILGEHHFIVIGRGLGDFDLDMKSVDTVGAGPAAALPGDFDGDGIPELVVVNYAKGHYVLKGRGACAYDPPHVGGTESVATADFDRDGR